MSPRSFAQVVCLVFLVSLHFKTLHAQDASEPLVIDIWPDEPPGETKELPDEVDKTKPEDRLIAGRRIIKLGNVSTPQIAIFKPPQEIDTGAAVVICPGGGHHILAYDLEGTEVADWLNSIGVTGIVLKYRVPFRDPDKRWRAAVQDAQRAMSIVRSRSNELGIDPERIGICGFSAGGETAGLTCIFKERIYEPVDAADESSFRPDFSLLIYAAGFVDRQTGVVHDHIDVDEQFPPTFFVHAFDDNVSVQNPLKLAAKIHQAGGTAELHVFATGGHGYGLRETDEKVTLWPKRAGEWLREQGFLNGNDDR